MENLLYKLTSPEIEKYLEKNDIVLCPVGSTEQHGRHMAVDNDAFTAFEISKRVAEQTDTVVAPTLNFGYSPHHMAFKGTITLTFATIVNIYKEICLSLLHHGFEKIVIMNAHGGNTDPIKQALKQIQDETGKRAYAVMVFPTPNGFGSEGTKILQQQGGGHACEMETSVGLYLGQRILMSEARKWTEEDSILDPEYKDKVTAPYTFDECTRIGNLGDPTIASFEKGKILVETVVEDISKFIETLKRGMG